VVVAVVLARISPVLLEVLPGVLQADPLGQGGEFVVDDRFLQDP
jgi:hypothetical protein